MEVIRISSRTTRNPGEHGASESVCLRRGEGGRENYANVRPLGHEQVHTAFPCVCCLWLVRYTLGLPGCDSGEVDQDKEI
jgi:hypothetical protein